MNNYEKLAFAANVALLLLIVAKLFDMWAIAVAFLTMMIIVMLYKMNFDSSIDDLSRKEKKRSFLLENAVKHIEEIVKITQEVKTEVDEKLAQNDLMVMEQIEFAKAEIRDEIKQKDEQKYDEFAKKIFDIENKMNQTKKTLAAYANYLESRMG